MLRYQKKKKIPRIPVYMEIVLPLYDFWNDAPPYLHSFFSTNSHNALRVAPGLEVCEHGLPLLWLAQWYVVALSDNFSY